MKCAYEDKECSSACIYTKTCAKWKLRNGKAPCRDCQDRSEECHTSCMAYKEWSNRQQERNAKIRKERIREQDLDEAKAAGIKRMKTRRV